MLNLQKNKGFSLAEMMVVMLMLSIIFAAAAPILTKRAASTSQTSGDTTPKGLISIWSGKISEIPSGWHLCDGTNGTPDLRNRFILCAGIDGTSTYTTGYGRKSDNTTTTPTGNASVGAKGGYDWVELSIDEMPSHTHTGSSSAAGAHTHTRGTMNITASLINNANPYSDFLGDHLSSINGAFTVTGAGKYWGTANGDSINYGYGALYFDASRSWTGETSSSGSHSHTMSLNNTGSNYGHENKPPYYALAYIMKIK